MSLTRIMNAVNAGVSEVHDFTAEIKDDVVIVTDKNELALPIVMTLNGDVIIAQTAIIPVSVIPESEQAIFNRAILESNPNTPLTNIGIVGGNYVAFGELSADSKDSVIFEEVETLAENVNDFAESVKSDFL